MKKVIIYLLVLLNILMFSACESNDKDKNPFLEYAEKEENSQETEESQYETIDPFEGLEVQFDGASPYLTIGFNNSKCRQEVQDYVTFTCEQEFFANGDVVTVKAEYNINNLNDLGLTIETDEKNYEVSGFPEYVNDISKIDTSVLDKEIQEYMDAHYLDVSSSYAFDIVNIMGAEIDGPEEFEKFKSSTIENKYLCVLKPNKIDEHEDYNYYYAFYHNVYNVGMYGATDCYDVDIYSCIYVKNIISYPDGTLKYDPELGHNANKSKEDAFYEGISVKKEDYNVSEIKE